MSSFDYCAKCGKLINIYNPKHYCPQGTLDEIEAFLRNAPVPPEEVADEIMKIILASKQSEETKNE